MRVAEIARLGRPGNGGTSTGSVADGARQVEGPAAKIPLKPPNNRHNLNNIG